MKKILVVEDEPEIRTLLNNFLTHEGFEVSLAEDGVEAISMFAKTPFDLVLLDIMIPKIDGFGVCEVIKKQSDAPVMFLSALNDDKSQIRGYDLMADDYVTKPFSMPILIRKINALLRRNDTVDNRKDSLLVCGDILINLHAAGVPPTQDPTPDVSAHADGKVGATGYCVELTDEGAWVSILQVRRDLCKNCNECRIAKVCPADAFVRVPADKPYIYRKPPEVKS